MFYINEIGVWKFANCVMNIQDRADNNSQSKATVIYTITIFFSSSPVKIQNVILVRADAIFNRVAKIRAQPLYVYQQASILYRHISPRVKVVRARRMRENGSYINNSQLIGRTREREESSFGHGCSRWHAIPRADYAPPPVHPSAPPRHKPVYVYTSHRSLA